MNPLSERAALLTRRHFLGRSALGLGTAALASLLHDDLFAADATGDPARVWVQSTTFDGNLISTAGSKPGGGIANGYSGSFFPNGGVLLLESVTLISNTNGLFSAAGDVHTVLHNTVLTQGQYLNCDGAGTPVTSNVFNFSSDTSCALGSSGDQQGARVRAFHEQGRPLRGCRRPRARSTRRVRHGSLRPVHRLVASEASPRALPRLLNDPRQGAVLTSRLVLNLLQHLLGEVKTLLPLVATGHGASAY